MSTAEITRNAITNTPMAIKRSGATLPIVVLSETSAHEHTYEERGGEFRE